MRLRFAFWRATSSVKNAFLIGEINFEKKFNTFENDTHEGSRGEETTKKKVVRKQQRDEIQLKKKRELFDEIFFLGR